MARKRFRNFTVAAILFFSLVAIVITGFGTGGVGGIDALTGKGGPTGDELAKVGSRPITTAEVNDQFNSDFQELRAEFRERQRDLQIAEFLEQNGLEGSVDRLVALEALRQFAGARGVVATRRMIDHAISSAPQYRFAMIGGTFNNQIFMQALQQEGKSVDQVREEFRSRLLYLQAVLPIQAGFGTPLGVAQAYATVPQEQRTGLVGLVPVEATRRGFNPSDAEIQAYYQRYRDFFAAPERRVIKYAVIGAEQVTVPPVTDAEIQAVYNNTPRYQAGQIRTLESVNFGNSGTAQADANAFVHRVRGGTSFQQAAQAAGRGDAYVRSANKNQREFANLVPPQVAAQAFGAAQGAVVGPVRSQIGWIVVRVETAAGGRPLETVRADIVREIERRKRTAAIAALVSQLEQQILDGTNFEDAANGAHLRIVTTPPITAQGRLANGQAWPELSPELRALLPAAFDMDPSDDKAQVPAIEENGRYALLGLGRVEAAAPPPLAEIRDRVRNQLIRGTGEVRARRIANEIAARINRGIPVAQAFAQAGLPLPPPETVRARRLEVMSGQPTATRLLFFRLRPGTAGAVAAPNGTGWNVVVPQQSMRATTATPQDAASAQQQLTQGAQGEALAQLLKAMELRIGTQRNTAAIRAERDRIARTMATPTQ